MLYKLSYKQLTTLYEILSLHSPLDPLPNFIFDFNIDSSINSTHQDWLIYWLILLF